jgi:hypothetical protein
MKKFVSRWLDVFDVYKSMPDALYKETDAGWTHHLPVEWLICVVIISDKNLYNMPYVSVSGCEGRKYVYLWDAALLQVLSSDTWS